MKISKNSEYIIECDKCGYSGLTSNIDGGYRYNDTPSRYFKRAGWRDVGGKTLCPACVKEMTRRNSHE